MKRWIWMVLGLAVGYGWFATPGSMPLVPLVHHDSQTAADREVLFGGPCTRERCLLVYLAPWCGVCRRSQPAVIAAARQLQSRGIGVSVVLGLAPETDLGTYAREFPFPVYLDRDRKLFDQLNARGVPYHAVWDRDGAIVSDVAGGFSAPEQLITYLQLEPTT